MYKRQPKDQFGLYQFDGTNCYEDQNPLRAEHKEWGTMVFDLSLIHISRGPACLPAAMWCWAQRRWYRLWHTPSGWPRPVSYTHLDVYKRQYVRGPYNRLLYALLVACCLLLVICYIKQFRTASRAIHRMMATLPLLAMVLGTVQYLFPPCLLYTSLYAQAEALCKGEKTMDEAVTGAKTELATYLAEKRA